MLTKLPTKKQLETSYLIELKSKKAIAKKYSITTYRVEKLFEKYNMKFRSFKECYDLGMINTRKYKKIDLDKFKKIDNKDLAYVLGYLAWAGSILKTSTSESMIITSSIKDKEYLVKLKKCLKIDNKFSYRTQTVNGREYGKFFLTISQQGIREALNKWHYGSRNVNMLDFPPLMPKKLLPHYLRGYFERHGGFCKNLTEPEPGFLSMSGPTIKFVTQFSEVLKDLGIYNTILENTSTKQSTVCRVRVMTVDMIKFAEILYPEVDLESSIFPEDTKAKKLFKSVRYWNSKKELIKAKQVFRPLVEAHGTEVSTMLIDEGLSYEEISEDLDIPFKYVKEYIQSKVLVED